MMNRFTNPIPMFCRMIVVIALVTLFLVWDPGISPRFDSLSYAQEPNQDKEILFQEIDELFKRAKTDEVHIYSAQNFAKANELYQKALAGFEQGERVENIRLSLYQATNFLNQASESTRAIKMEFADLFAIIEEANGLPPGQKESREAFFKAKDAFQQFITYLNEGNLDRARGISREAEKSYREAISLAWQDKFFKDMTKSLEDTSEHIPSERFKKSSQNEKKAEAFLNKARADGMFTGELLKMIDEIKWEHISPKPLPDLTVIFYDKPFSQIKGIYPFPPLTDRPTTLSVLVKNKGLLAVNAGFNTELYVDGTLAKTWTFSPVSPGEDPYHVENALKPGETRIYEYEVSFPQGGTHTFRWVVDAKNEIKESDESRNSNVLDTSFIWQDSPDLIVEDIQPVGEFAGGLKTTWNIKIKNIGSGPVNTFFPTVLWPDAAGGTQEEFWTTSLNANQAIIFTPTQSFQVWGNQKIRAVVDPNNFVTEANENNNELVKNINLASVDLVVENLVVNPQHPNSGESTTFSFTIKNIGQGSAAQPFKVRVLPGEITQKGLTQSKLFTVNGLEAGQAIELIHTLTLRPGHQKVFIEADHPDPNAVYFEPNRINNTLVKDIYVTGYLSTFAFYLGESIYINPADPADVNRDLDGDLLKDDLEGKLAEAFRPFFKFDSDENEKYRRPSEPVTLFQVRPKGCSGLGCSGKTEIWIRWAFLFEWDGGYGPNSWEGKDAHKGDNDKALYKLISFDNGFTWKVVSIVIADWRSHPFTWPGGYIVPYSAVNRMVRPWTPMKIQLYQNHHPVIYMSAHKHHMYFSTGWDHKDSYYSKAPWHMNDDVNGKGDSFLADIHSVFKDHRYNNVGEPEIMLKPNPPAYFVTCMPQFRAAVTIVNGKVLVINKKYGVGDQECNYEFYSAWGTGSFYKAGSNAKIWLTAKECKWWSQ